ncbi:unnamed protein product [Leptosia nina]|uniref:Uncharacterized protein n=1 Tax=Leptosia nina TaxID=320188 RepID=A0AAV1J8H3_9NEOP
MALRTVFIFICAISVISAAPANRDSQRAEYDYEYENSAQSQEPAESNHYDAYIQDVKAAASGEANKKGYSRGSGLRTIAVGSANQAKTALGNQQAAAYQAAYVAKNTLAQSASQASATAQAALAGKQVILSGLEQQVRDAKVALQGEEMQLQQAKRAAQSAAQAAQQAMHQVNVIQAALNAAQATSENANEAASQAAGELGAQTAMVGAARQRLQTLQEQLKGVRIDFEATQSAARKAQAAAQQAQANAAEAAAKAAAAGLGQQHDSSHEGTSSEEYKRAPENQEYYQTEYQHHTGLVKDNVLSEPRLRQQEEGNRRYAAPQEPLKFNMSPYKSHIKSNSVEFKILRPPKSGQVSATGSNGNAKSLNAENHFPTFKNEHVLSSALPEPVHEEPPQEEEEEDCEE